MAPGASFVGGTFDLETLRTCLQYAADSLEWLTAVDAHICLFYVECHQEVKQRSATNALMRLRRTAAYFRNPSAVRVVTSVFRVVLLDDIRATKDKMLVQPVRAICIQRRWAGSTYETL